MDLKSDFESVLNKDGTPSILKRRIFKESFSTLSPKKAKKEISLDCLVVEINGVSYDAHKDGLANMTSIVSLANQKVFKLIAGGVSASDAYNAVFKSSTEWRGYDNKLHTIQIESIAEALELAMKERGSIYGV